MFFQRGKFTQHIHTLHTSRFYAVSLPLPPSTIQCLFRGVTGNKVDRREIRSALIVGLGVRPVGPHSPDDKEDMSYDVPRIKEFKIHYE